MIFLNYRHLDDFFQISENSVRPTDGINLNEATLCIKARQSFNQTQPIRIVAHIVLTYANPELFVTYSCGARKFDRLRFKEQLISKVELRVVEAFGADLQKGSVLFEKTFSPPEHGMDFACSGTSVYSAPVLGSAQPLWHIGGAWNGDELESLCICPLISEADPSKAEIVRVFFSEIIDLSEFAVVPDQPWSLRNCIESGQITFGGYISAFIDALSKESITITFTTEDYHEDGKHARS
jgi:hypothetical protein